MTIKVGDKLAQKAYPTYRIFTVIKILPSGRIKAQWDDDIGRTYTLNSDLYIRGEMRYSHNQLQILTQDVRDDIERHRLLQRIEIGFVLRNKLTLVQVQSLHQWMTDAGLLTD